MQAPSRPRILCVDDEPNVLAALRRGLYEHFDVDTAPSGVEALTKLGSTGPYEVVVSDMRMPRMNGATFLTRARRASPHTVRLLLTGQANLDDAVAAVNDGQIFRFLTKPCPQPQLLAALQDAVAHYRRLETERVLLEQTLSGAVRLLTDVLAIASPASFLRAARVKSLVAHLCDRLEVEQRWDIELAALLSQLGAITLPDATLDNLLHLRAIEPSERSMVDAVPEVGARLLAHIPRLELVAEMIRGQRGDYRPTDPQAQLGASLLHAALSVDDKLRRRADLGLALRELGTAGAVSYKLLRLLEDFPFGHIGDRVRLVTLRELTAGMVFDRDALASTGVVVVSQNTVLTEALIERLRNFARGVGIEEPLQVRLPPEEPDVPDSEADTLTLGGDGA